MFLTWAECEEQIKGFTGARYKKFSNAAEAEAFVTRALVAGASPTDPSVGTSDSKGKKRAVPAELEDESRFDIVYSDGACKGNGKAGSIAGIGVWWGRNDPRNMAERCPGDQTNNRAELIAIVRVLETAPRTKKPLLIKTDSMYSINCFQKWLPNWRSNGFKTSDGQPVKNAGVIRYLSAHLDARAFYGQQIRLKHVKGHSGEEGNEGADTEANRGALLPALPERDWEQLEVELREQMEVEQATRMDDERPVPVEVEADSLPTGNAMKVRKIGGEGTSAAHVTSPPTADALSTEHFDSSTSKPCSPPPVDAQIIDPPSPTKAIALPAERSDPSSIPQLKAPPPEVDSQLMEAPSLPRPGFTGPSTSSSPRKIAASASKTQAIIAAIRSPSKAKSSHDQSNLSSRLLQRGATLSKAASVMQSFLPTKPTNSSSPKRAPSPTKMQSRIPLPSPSKTVYSRDPPASSSSSKGQVIHAEDSQDSQSTQSTTAESFVTALTTITPIPVESPSIEPAPAVQNTSLSLLEPLTKEDPPKRPARIVVDKEDVDFSMYVDCYVDPEDLWKDLYP